MNELSKNEVNNERLPTEFDSAGNSLEYSLSTRAIVRIVLLILTVLFLVTVAGALVYWLSGLILLMVLAIFFAYLLAPLVDLVMHPFVARNHARWMPRPLAIGIVYIFLFLVLYGAGAYLLPLVGEQISQFAQQVPTYTEQVRTRLEELNRRYERTAIPPALREEVEKSLTDLAKTAGGITTETLWTLIWDTVAFVPWVILIPILGFFFLKDAELFKLAAVRAFPRGRLRGRAELFLQDLNKTLRAYTRAQLISCALIGTVCTIAFYAIGVKYALLLGLVAAVLEFIPLVGPLIVGILATLIASFYSWRQALTVAIFLLILRLIHDYVTYPRIVREGVHLHPLAIVLAVLAGGEIGGITGIFLSIPVVAVITVVYRHMMEHSGSTGLVAELLDKGETDKAIDVAEKQLATIHENAVKNERVTDN